MRSITWYAPDSFVGWQKNGDVRSWGFSLDARTELTYYTYEWGRGITFRLFGFGFDLVWLNGMDTYKYKDFDDDDSN